MHGITVGPPDQPDTSIVLHPPAVGPGITDDEKRNHRREGWAKGTFAINLATKDLDVTFSSGCRLGDADIVQELIEQPYGVRDGAIRDPAGNLDPHPGTALGHPETGQESRSTHHRAASRVAVRAQKERT